MCQLGYRHEAISRPWHKCITVCETSTCALRVFVVLVLLLVVYLLTLAPTITWAHHGADGGDLVAAVARGSIPHPPGFPTYLLLGDLFVRLPWGNLAWRLNLMSAVLAAGAAALTDVCNSATVLELTS